MKKCFIILKIEDWRTIGYEYTPEYGFGRLLVDRCNFKEGKVVTFHSAYTDAEKASGVLESLKLSYEQKCEYIEKGYQWQMHEKKSGFLMFELAPGECLPEALQYHE